MGKKNNTVIELSRAYLDQVTSINKEVYTNILPIRATHLVAMLPKKTKKTVEEAFGLDVKLKEYYIIEAWDSRADVVSEDSKGLVFQPLGEYMGCIASLTRDETPEVSTDLFFLFVFKKNKKGNWKLHLKLHPKAGPKDTDHYLLESIKLLSTHIRRELGSTYLVLPVKD